jgi:hypothetical protein
MTKASRNNSKTIREICGKTIQRQCKTIREICGKHSRDNTQKTTCEI